MLCKNLEVLGCELPGVSPDQNEGLTIDAWLNLVQVHMQQFTGCRVSIEHIESLATSIVPFKMEASAATAFIILRSDVMKDLVGCLDVTEDRRVCSGDRKQHENA